MRVTSRLAVCLSGKTLNQTILVPFPLEACLSGAFQWPSYSKFLWYRVVFDAPFTSGRTLLHFGGKKIHNACGSHERGIFPYPFARLTAVDWNTTVYFNGATIGSHLGGYDAFSFDITSALTATNNELILSVYDPSDEGFQGKVAIITPVLLLSHVAVHVPLQ
jgi:hypothetical protein